MHSFFKIFVLSASGIMLFHASSAHAQYWVEYASDSGVFTTKAPEEYESKISEFLVDNKLSVSSEEMSALIDYRPFKNVIKGYIVRSDQTIGGGLTDTQIADLLERELNLYEDFYMAYGGHVRGRKTDGMLGYPGGELLVTYDDPQLGTQVVKIRVLFSTSTRLEQIAIVPVETIDAMVNRDFFDSLTFLDGLKITEKTLKFEWEQQVSPLGIFTVNIPQITDPYFPFPPKIQHSTDAEIITLLFRDPVRNEGLYYSVYAYKFNREITNLDIQSLIVNKHVTKHNLKPSDIEISITDERFDPNAPPAAKKKPRRRLIDTHFNIPVNKDFPYLQTVKIHAMNEGKFLLVQELVGSQALTHSPFAKVLLKSIDFHPADYHEPLEKTPVTAGANEMDMPIPYLPGGSDALTNKLKSAITTTTRQSKVRRQPDAEKLKPLSDTLPVNEAIPDRPIVAPPVIPTPPAAATPPASP